MVSPAKQIFKDFSSGKGGNVVSFLMDHEHFSYPEALRWLADKYGIEIDEGPRSEEDIKREGERESLFIVSNYANESFIKNLHETEEGQNVGLSYFRERGFTEKTIRDFQLGYALEDGNAFSGQAVADGYQEKYLVDSGLSIKRDSGGLWDRFRGRVIFPIKNLSGKVIGFGGRILNTEAKTAKYLNSPESLIYHKSKVLYGLFESKGAIIKQDRCLLVEGYTDVISLHQAGVENVVSSSGTSLTVDQIKLIKRYTKNVTVLFDGDSAGIRASFRGIDMLLQQGMDIRVVPFPEGEDPDSYARKLDTDELKVFLDSGSQDFMTFKTNVLIKETEGDPIRKAEVVRDIVTSISMISDQIKRSVYLRECSRIMEIPEPALISELNKIVSARNTSRARTVQQKVDANPFLEKVYEQEPTEDAGALKVSKEKEIIRLLLVHGDKTIRLLVRTQDEDGEEQELDLDVNVAEYIVRDLQFDEITLSHAPYAAIMSEYVTHLDERQIPEDRYFISHPDAEIAKIAVDLITSQYELSNNWTDRHNILVAKEEDNVKAAIHKGVNGYKLFLIEEMISKKRESIKIPTEGEVPVDQLEDILSLERIKSMLANGMLGRVVTR